MTHTISEAETLGKSEYNNFIHGLSHEQLLIEAGMDEAFVKKNNITDKDIIKSLLY